jgi:hypothetical protein
MGIQKKFADDLQIYVFTTRFVIEDKSDIIFISHDKDGDWQFMGADQFSEDDARIISLEEMIEHDPSVLEVADLPFGYEAERTDKLAKWTVRKS